MLSSELQTRELCETGIERAQGVIDAWCSGDLAAAVRGLDEWITGARQVFEETASPATIRRVFHTTAREHAHRRGQVCTVVRPLYPSEYDATETGPMYRVRFEDGAEIDVFAEELHRDRQQLAGLIGDEPRIRELVIGLEGILNMSDQNHPSYRDSCCDAMDQLWQHEDAIRELAAAGAAVMTPPDASTGNAETMKLL